MNLKIQNISRIIRFRRWSRNKFAAFQSIGKCVNIGYVCKSIAEISLKKQFCIFNRFETEDCISYPIEENEDKEDMLYDILLRQAGISLVLKSEDTFASDLIFNYKM